MTTPLGKRIARQLEMTGQMPLVEFMHLCLADPKDGYYRVRQAIGRDGDFITAPETSQMFGELLGVWAVQTWKQLGCPSPFNLVELGPGKRHADGGFAPGNPYLARLHGGGTGSIDRDQ